MHAASAPEIQLLLWRNREYGWKQLELVPLNLEKSGNSFCTWLHESQGEESWLDSSVAKAALTCKWLHAGAGTSELTWPLQRRSGTAPRRTSSSAESETSGRLRWRTPSRRTTGPVEEVRTYRRWWFSFWVSSKTQFSFLDASKILNFHRSCFYYTVVLFLLSNA